MSASLVAVFIIASGRDIEPLKLPVADVVAGRGVVIANSSLLNTRPRQRY